MPEVILPGKLVWFKKTNMLVTSDFWWRVIVHLTLCTCRGIQKLHKNHYFCGLFIMLKHYKMLFENVPKWLFELCKHSSLYTLARSNVTSILIGVDAKLAILDQKKSNKKDCLKNSYLYILHRGFNNHKLRSFLTWCSFLIFSCSNNSTITNVCLSVQAFQLV